MFTKEEISAGLALAGEWYEGHKVNELGSDQLLECIEKAKVANLENFVHQTSGN